MNGSLFARMLQDAPAEKVPMHPEDYAALREWVRAKEHRDPVGPGILPENRPSPEP